MPITKSIAENAYKRYLSKIEAKYGKKETDSDKLNLIGKRLFSNKFVGVFSKDKIPRMKSGQYAIINLDDSGQPGSHWVSLVKSRKKYVIYDSFGRNTTNILPNFQKGYGKIMNTENDVEQSRAEENCGQRSLASLCVYDNFGYSGLRHI